MLQHGLILFETAKHENHATARIDDANPDDPSRIGIILFQHQKLDRPNHNCLEKEMPDEHAAIDEEEPIPSKSGNKNAKDAGAIKDKYKNDLLSGLGCQCHCYNIEKMGPIYHQMGFSSSVEDIHEKFCHEFSLSKEEINLIETYYCPNFETDDYGFTIAQEFIDRSLNLEKITILYRKKLGS